MSKTQNLVIHSIKSELLKTILGMNRIHYRGAFGTRCITLEPSEVTAGVYIKKVGFRGMANVEGHMIVPAYKRTFISVLKNSICIIEYSKKQSNNQIHNPFKIAIIECHITIPFTYNRKSITFPELHTLENHIKQSIPYTHHFIH